MNLNNLTLEDICKLVSSLSGDCSTNNKPATKALAGGNLLDLGLQIVVLDRGFVYVGLTHVADDFCYIKNAKCIRRWGTTKGLGELAQRGPLKDTVLDSSGLVRAPLRSVIHFIECCAGNWK